MTTAVWVGDPNSYKSMVNIAEFRKDGVSKVQGGTYPARIWRAYMEGPAPSALQVLDWPGPPAPARGAANLYLPGVECLYQQVGGGAAVTTTTAAPTNGFLKPQSNPQSPPSTAPPAGEPTDTTPVETTVPPPVYKRLPSGTTIAPDNLDPNAGAERGKVGPRGQLQRGTDTDTDDDGHRLMDGPTLLALQDIGAAIDQIGHRRRRLPELARRAAAASTVRTLTDERDAATQRAAQAEEEVAAAEKSALDLAAKRA